MYMHCITCYMLPGNRSVVVSEIRHNSGVTTRLQLSKNAVTFKKTSLKNVEIAQLLSF